MATSKPMLGDIELQQVQKIEVDEDQVLAQQSVPALEGDFLQRLGRRGTQISLTGVLTGAEAGTGLKTLQEKFRAAAPVSFVADIATATQVEKVLIEEMGIRELAGKPSRFEYSLTLREFTPPPAPEPVPPPSPTPPPPSVETGTLVVEVTVEGQPGCDFSKVTVSVEGTQDDGKSLTRTLTNRSNNSWTEENMPPGKYTAKAVVTDPQSLSGAATVTVSAGQTAKASITLQSGSLIAKAFVVHFRFDKAFVEPCMLEVLKTVVTYANAHSDEKLVIVGHTDLTGTDVYNQSLSERRGRSVYAALSYGRDKATALAEWNALRQPTDGALPSIKDSWGVREYQYLLQDLDFYSGNIDGVQGPETDAAVRDFQGSKGLTVDGIVGGQTWSALIEAYLDQYNLTIPEAQFLPNCGGEILKWLGCGEQDPVKNTPDAWRPNRRTELLFVKASTLPCQVPQPETFDLPAAGAVGSKWCLGPGDKNQRNCFATRKNPEPGKWLIQPVEPDTITVRGSITFEDGTPAGNMKYVLIAPDGEFMDGEVARGADHGIPIPRRTNDDGTFAYPDKQKGVGIYTLEVIASVVARAAGVPPDAAKGNVVCRRLDSTSVFKVIVAPAERGNPILKLHGTVFDRFGDVRKQTQVELLFSDGSHANTTTDNTGKFVIEMDPLQEVAKIRYNVTNEEPIDTVFFANYFIDVKEINTDEGVRRRLHNLGYPAEDDLVGAITAFQAAQGLDTTGEADQLTRAKLVAVHDGNEAPVPDFKFSEEPLKPEDLTEDVPLN